MAKPKKTSVKPQLPKENMKNAVKRSVSGYRTLHDEDRHWYDLPEEKVGMAIQQVVIQIDNNTTDLRQKWETYARMYGNYDTLGLNSGTTSDMFYDGSTNLPCYNVVQSAIDTLLSKIIRDNPKPYFITSGADYFTKLKAEKQTQFIQGVFQDCQLYDKANNQVCRDAAVYGIGGLRFGIDAQTHKITADWIFIDEIKIDRIDAMKKKPRSIHLCSLVQKEMVEQQYPDKQELIDDINDQHPEYLRSRETVVELMIITESWHLANGDKPGRHVVSCQDKVFLDEEYDYDFYPVVFFNYYDNAAGIYGRGIADTLFNHQIEINKILLMIQQSQELQAAPLILVPNEAEIAADILLSNNIARMVPYRGNTPPTFVSPQALSQEVYQHLLWWVQASYQEVGISLTSATGEKQPGVNSAVAMRTMVDIESSRFIQVSKNWEKFFVDCAKVCMCLGKQAYKDNPDFKVMYLDKKSKILKEIPWKKVDAPDDMFTVQCDTISSFGSTAAGRIQTVTEFISNGWFSKQRGLEMLGMDPDLDQEIKLQTSSLRLCEKRLSEMVEEGTYYHPEPFMDLKLAQQVSEMVYNQLVLDDCPEDRLQLVRMWIEEINTLLGGQDPIVAQLQATFTPPQPAPQAPVAPQAGIAPAAGIQ